MNSNDIIKTILITLVVGLFGISVFSIGYDYSKKRTLMNFDKAMAEFTAGYNDGTITDISDFTIYCSPDNVEVFNWIDFNSQPQGILFRCLKDNTTIPLKYSDRFNKQYKEIK